MRWYSTVKIHITWVGDNKWEDNHNCRNSPQWSRRLSLMSCSLSWGSCTKTSPRNIWLWRPMGLVYGKARKPEGCTKHRLFLKSMHKISHTLSCSRKKPESDPLADLRLKSRRKLELPLGTQMLTALFCGELILLWGCLCWQAPFWSSPSSLLVPEVYTSTSKLAPALWLLGLPS